MHRRFWLSSLAALFSCGPSSSLSDGGNPGNSPGVVLRAALGGYSIEGSPGGIGLLASIELPPGSSPTSWNGTLAAADGTWTGTVNIQADKRWTETWFANARLVRGATYVLSVSDLDGRTARREVTAPVQGAFGTVNPRLTPDAGALAWPSVDGAATYTCYFHNVAWNDQLQSTRAPACSLGQLAAEPWDVSISASSVDLQALADGGAFPDHYDYSVAFLGLWMGRSPTLLQASPGVVGMADAGSALAIALTLTAASGSAPPGSWAALVSGPGISTASYKVVALDAGTTRAAVWFPGIVPQSGVYNVSVQSGSAAASVSHKYAPGDALPLAAGVAATPRNDGGVDITWGAVNGAHSYKATLVDHVTGQVAASVWSSSPQASFAEGTATHGASYDVIIGATNVSLDSSVALPSAVQGSDTRGSPTAFVPP